MMSFAIQNWMHNKVMWDMQCCDKSDEWKKCNAKCCYSSNIEINPILLNSSNDKIILKIKLISFINIFYSSSKFLENKNLIKTNSPPNIENKIKFYSYSDLVKIIKSNT